MNTNGTIIRFEEKEDYRTVENLVRESFWNVYRPGCYEHYLIHTMRDHEDFVKELDFVLVKDTEIIGQVVYVQTNLQLDNGCLYPILTMGPICIANEYKRQGYGKFLLDYSLEQAKELGFKGVCMEGNIDFYGKCGFVYSSLKGIRYHDLPEGADADFFLCKELENGYFEGISGVYATPECYFVVEKNPDEFEKFDAKFPKKEKLVLPGQLF